MEPFQGISTFFRCEHYLNYGLFRKPEHTGDDIIIAGIPFDCGVTNRPGARFGPRSIREASLMLCNEDDHEFQFCPLDKLFVADGGDFEVSSYVDTSIKLIQEQAAGHTGTHHLISVGGDHTITLPLLRNMREKVGEPLALVHFDAHYDTWDHGTEFGHGSFLFHAINEGLVDPTATVQVGIRSTANRQPREFAREAGVTTITSDNVHRLGLGHVSQTIFQTVRDRPTYMTFDIDAIDPGQAPGTGTPEVGGLFTWQILALFKILDSWDIDWVGMDITEVAPNYDISDITSLTAANIIYKYLCLLANKDRDRSGTLPDRVGRTIYEAKGFD